MELNAITGAVVQSAIRVHSLLGPGLLESAYRKCLVHDLARRGLKVEAEHALPIEFDGLLIDAGYRLDLLVEDLVIVEVKTVNKLLPVHQAQLLSYLRLSDREVGLLINFNVWRLTDGIQRMVNAFRWRKESASRNSSR
jgi:GxxExxY protein